MFVNDSFLFNGLKCYQSSGKKKSAKNIFIAYKMFIKRVHADNTWPSSPFDREDIGLSIELKFIYKLIII